MSEDSSNPQPPSERAAGQACEHEWVYLGVVTKCDTTGNIVPHAALIVGTAYHCRLCHAEIIREDENNESQMEIY